MELCETVLQVCIGTLNRHCKFTTPHSSDAAHAPFDPILYTEGKSVQNEEPYINK
jgi:hypothetical protein